MTVRRATPPPRCAAALAAAARGWPVFPLYPYTTRPAVDDWENAATCDEDAIAATWAARPYNIGIPCGRAGLVVIDLDPARGKPPPPRWADLGVAHGRDVLRILAERAGQPDPVDTYSVRSPGKDGPRGKGEHRYFSVPEGVNLRNTAGDRGNGLGWRVDTRAAGGFITAAGSVRRVNGQLTRYSVLRDLPVAPLPLFLVEALTPPPMPARAPLPVFGDDRARNAYGEKALADEAAIVRHAECGTRSAVVFSAARKMGELVGAGVLDERRAVDVLLDAAGVHNGIDGWTPREGLHHVGNGIAWGKRHPRVIDGLTA